MRRLSTRDDVYNAVTPTHTNIDHNSLMLSVLVQPTHHIGPTMPWQYAESLISQGCTANHCNPLHWQKNIAPKIFRNRSPFYRRIPYVMEPHITTSATGFSLELLLKRMWFSVVLPKKYVFCKRVKGEEFEFASRKHFIPSRNLLACLMGISETYPSRIRPRASDVCWCPPPPLTAPPSKAARYFFDCNCVIGNSLFLLK